MGKNVIASVSDGGENDLEGLAMEALSEEVVLKQGLSRGYDSRRLEFMMVEKKA